MTSRIDPPPIPRRGRALNVLGICRISTEHQDKKSLGDQEAHLRRSVQEHYNGPRPLDDHRRPGLGRVSRRQGSRRSRGDRG